jgi:hypothetical protein
MILYFIIIITHSQMISEYFLEADDDTYIYGNKMFECEFCEETQTYIQPFIRKENNKIIKYFRDEHFFVIYENAEIIEIVKTSTCWSDDFIAYKIKNQIAYQFDKNYHGRPCNRNKECNIDFSEFIKEYKL